MNWWQIILLVIGVNWGLPLVGCWAYALFCSLIGDWVYIGRYGLFAKFRLSYTMEKWDDKLWRSWEGIGLFFFMVFRDDPGPQDDAFVAETVVHEGTHCWQWLVLGLLMPISTEAHILFIYFFQPDKNPYLDCWSERMARRRAGELVDIPRKDWPDNGRRNPWW